MEFLTFDGDLSQWPAFRDFFQESVDDDDDLDQLSKRIYLRKFLTDAKSPHRDSHQTKGLSYDEIWTLTRNHYDELSFDASIISDRSASSSASNDDPSAPYELTTGANRQLFASPHWLQLPSHYPEPPLVSPSTSSDMESPRFDGDLAAALLILNDSSHSSVSDDDPPARQPGSDTKSPDRRDDRASPTPSEIDASFLQQSSSARISTTTSRSSSPAATEPSIDDESPFTRSSASSPTYKGFSQRLVEQLPQLSSVLTLPTSAEPPPSAVKPAHIVASTTATSSQPPTTTQRQNHPPQMLPLHRLRAAAIHQPPSRIVTTELTPELPTTKSSSCSRSFDRRLRHEQLRKLPIDQRIPKVRQWHRYFNCLGQHGRHNCQSINSCRRCRRHHHTLLHEASLQSWSRQPHAHPQQRTSPPVLTRQPKGAPTQLSARSASTAEVKRPALIRTRTIWNSRFHLKYRSSGCNDAESSIARSSKSDPTQRSQPQLTVAESPQRQPGINHPRATCAHRSSSPVDRSPEEHTTLSATHTSPASSEAQQPQPRLPEPSDVQRSTLASASPYRWTHLLLAIQHALDQHHHNSLAANPITSVSHINSQIQHLSFADKSKEDITKIWPATLLRPSPTSPSLPGTKPTGSCFRFHLAAKLQQSIRTLNRHLPTKIIYHSIKVS
jgi:hypothetical protein